MRDGTEIWTERPASEPFTEIKFAAPDYQPVKSMVPMIENIPLSSCPSEGAAGITAWFIKIHDK